MLEATGDGVELYDLDSVWWRYHRIADVGVCRLMLPGGLTDDDHARLYSFIESVRGRPYEKSLFSLVQKVTRPPSRASKDEDHRKAPPTELICSELVAHAYRVVGLLSEKAAMELLPKHFDTTECELKLEREARLFPPRLLAKNPEAE